jgi:hypothetical protein
MASDNQNPDNEDKQDSAYNPGEQAYLEGMGAGNKKPATDEEATSDFVRDDEEAGGGWKNQVSSSYAGNRSKSGQGISKANFKAVLKKRGPLAAIITLLAGGGIGAGIFFGPSLLLVQVQESFLNTFDTQNTSLTIRTNKILSNKLVEQNTSGSCNYVKIACRFSRPSNKLLGNLEKNGIQAFDKSGAKITKTGPFQASRPATYEFNGKPILASNFSSELRNNNAFRAAFHSAYNPRFVGFTDSVFKGIQKRFGFDITNKDGASTDKTVKEKLNDASKGVNALGDGADAATEDVSKGLVQKLLGAKASEIVTKIGNGGKGDAFGLIAASVCTVADIPKLIITVVRSYQLVQVVNYSMQFLIAGSALKAGQITPDQATALGALLTASVANKTAMDSFGMKYAMFGDTKPSKSSKYSKFIPGGSAVGALGGAAAVLSGGVKTGICDFATNPATGAAVNVGLAVAGPETLGVSLLVAGINIGAGLVIGEVVTRVGAPLIAEFVKNIDVKPLLSFFVGDLTQNLSGEDVGDALTSGASNMMSATANAGGNMPLTVSDAVAYNQSTKDVNIAYAQEDRATHSPLDPTNPNTMVGSFVGKIIPYFASISSVSSALKSIATLPSGSLATLINSSTASALTAEQYSMCNDPSVTDAGVAAGPFCNVQYGIPQQYLDRDPQQIVDALIASKDIDETTGDPIEGSGLSTWVNTCTDGSTEELKNCMIVDNKTANYSLYIIDHRIQKSMDEDDASNSTDTTDTTTSVNPTPSEDTISLAVAPATGPVAPFTPDTSAISEDTTNKSSLSTGIVSSLYKPRINQGWYWSAA